VPRLSLQAGYSSSAITDWLAMNSRSDARVSDAASKV
jgi:hypothetical protein